ncbi:MAG: UDP-N-acetylglucosamine--N-acetylmuramyl-(pentapeptide) pyrophosphoryl-undecaprenol [Verrucomicrobiota bacterium]|nr:UDP-N-acetylglucosamine--N-acetylmuramyl-(pentapeptide) pyrophosphoryl-undecaprenol [Verrucomicrobiota bacterium]
MSSFLIACGGTGGHLSPGIALAEALVERGHAVTLLISLKKVDARLSEKYPQLRFERVPSAPLGWSPAVFARFVRDQARGLVHCRRLVARLKPDVIIGFGGFTNAGVVLA